MGLFDSLTSLIPSALSDVFGSGSNAISGGSNVGGLDTGTSPFPVNYPTVPEYGTPYPQAQPVMGTAPMIIAGGRALALRFPSLFASLTVLSQRFGTRISVERLWGMFKTFGPGIAALIGAEALQELMVYHSVHKRRRMNVANTKALRRSVRRLKGFDRLAHRVSSQLARVGGTRRRPASRRCGTCRHSPCTC
jgi:hypothetical protein